MNVLHDYGEHMKHEQHTVNVSIRLQPSVVCKLLKLAGPHGTLSKVVRALIVKGLTA